MTPRRGGRAILAIGLLPVLSLAGALAGAPTDLGAQETIASDRPGIGSGAYVLGPGTIQLETGLQLSRDGGSSGSKAYSFGQALVRIGFAALEVQVLLNSVVLDRGNDVGGSDSWGVEDTGFGVKLPLVRDSDRLTLALQGIVTPATGSDGFTRGTTGGTLNALADIVLGDRTGMSVNLGHERGFESGGGVTSVIVTPGVSLGSGFGAYGGWAGSFASGGGSAHTAEAGLTYLAGANLQLDVNGGVDASEPGDRWFFGVGVATRRGGR